MAPLYPLLFLCCRVLSFSRFLDSFFELHLYYSELVLVTTMHVCPLCSLCCVSSIVVKPWGILSAKLNKTFQLQGIALCLYILCPWFLWEKPYNDCIPGDTDSWELSPVLCLYTIQVLGPVHELQTMILLPPPWRNRVHTLVNQDDPNKSIVCDKLSIEQELRLVNSNASN